jgi:hypothetical protein
MNANGREWELAAKERRKRKKRFWQNRDAVELGSPRAGSEAAMIDGRPEVFRKCFLYFKKRYGAG